VIPRSKDALMLAGEEITRVVSDQRILETALGQRAEATVYCDELDKHECASH
jgi:hypothetical protein